MKNYCTIWYCFQYKYVCFYLYVCFDFWFFGDEIGALFCCFTMWCTIVLCGWSSLSKMAYLCGFLSFNYPLEISGNNYFLKFRWCPSIVVGARKKFALPSFLIYTGHETVPPLKTGFCRMWNGRSLKTEYRFVGPIFIGE